MKQKPIINISDQRRIICVVCGSAIMKSEMKRHMNRHTKLQKYFCNKCNYSTSTKSNLKTHINGVHLKLKRFFCDLCNFACYAKRNLERHQSHHYDKEKISCEVCGFAVNEASLRRHINEVHLKLKNYICKVCNFSCFRKHELKLHQMKKRCQNENTTNNSKNLHECTTCGKKFCNEGSLKRHKVTVHEGKKDFKCLFCQRSCVSNTDLKRHFHAVHEGRKDFKCDFCGKLFALVHQVKVHIQKIHKARKYFKCDLCGKSFRKAGHLKLHSAACNDKKEYCILCETTFPNLKYHISFVHEGQGDFKCNICGKEFGKVGYLKLHRAACNDKKVKIHIQNIHRVDDQENVIIIKTEDVIENVHEGEKFSENEKDAILPDPHILSKICKKYFCEICNYSCYSTRELTLHSIRRHLRSGLLHSIKISKNVTENVLENVSENVSENIAEILNVHEDENISVNFKNPFSFNSLKCTTCGKAFCSEASLKRHKITVHEGKKGIKCFLCQRSFVSKDYIKRHVDAVHNKIKDHKCDFCGNLFALAHQMKNHVQKVHKARKDFKCNVCGKLFRKAGYLKLHSVACNGK